MALTLDDAKAAKDEADDDQLRDNDAGVPDDQRMDYEQHDAPILRGHPESMITYDRIVGVDVFNTGDDFLEVQNNLELGGYNNYGNDVVLTVEGPSLAAGELWSEVHDFRDLRVLGDPTADDSPYERRTDVDESGEEISVEINGVSLGMGGFDGEPADDEFDTEYLQIFISSSRAADVLGQLDTAGKWAFTSEGELTEGIIETPPEFGSEGYDAEAHGAPRAIGYPELRADMVDQRGAIAWTFGDDEPTTQSPVEVDIFRLTEDDGTTEMAKCVPLTPGDAPYAKPTYPRAGNLYYDANATADVSADAEPETDEGVADASELIDANSADDDTKDALLAYEDLTEAGQEFVDAAVDAAETQGYDSVTAFDDWDDRYAVGVAQDGIEADQDELAEVIDAYIGESAEA
jgi:hypothetical protein